MTTYYSTYYLLQSYPEDALKIKVKHGFFFNQMSKMNQIEEDVST